MQVIGVDLSGPGSPENTSVAAFHVAGAELRYDTLIEAAHDQVLYEEIGSRLTQDDVVVGLDAPLSYGETGGQRRADGELRKKVTALGLPPGSVMAPTAPRMAYLTLRGLGVSRGLQLLGGPGTLRVVETHPGAALALGGAPVKSIRRFRDELDHRRRLLRWLADQGLKGMGQNILYSDHSVAACAGAWAAWLWLRGKSHWLYPAEPPYHPFEFAC